MRLTRALVLGGVVIAAVGGGGTGNLDESKPIGLALVTYRTDPRFAPLAADLVEIDPGSGSARATRQRLDLSRRSG